MSSKILITGSSGFVCSTLIPMVKNHFYDVVGVDLVHSAFTDIVSDISSTNLSAELNVNCDYIIIHCAAARFDYGISAKKYLAENVFKTRAFLKTLETINVSQFIHISSVAAIDGETIGYSDDLNCDDAYRSTKYLQQCEVIEWCQLNNVPWDVLLPSAIYDDAPRSDTNIGKLQKLIQVLPFLPAIEVKKSLTYLPKFCEFVIKRFNRASLKYFLTIDTPVLTVSQIICEHAGRNKMLIKVPGLRYGLFLSACVVLFFSKAAGRDPLLTPSRVTKLFSDTSYATTSRHIDRDTYHGDKK